jgi:hypothetical protein
VPPPARRSEIAVFVLPNGFSELPAISYSLWSRSGALACASGSRFLGVACADPRRVEFVAKISPADPYHCCKKGVQAPPPGKAYFGCVSSTRLLFYRAHHPLFDGSDLTHSHAHTLLFLSQFKYPFLILLSLHRHHRLLSLPPPYHIQLHITAESTRYWLGFVRHTLLRPISLHFLNPSQASLFLFLALIFLPRE